MLIFRASANISTSSENQHLALAIFASTFNELLEIKDIYMKPATNISFDCQSFGHFVIWSLGH